MRIGISSTTFEPHLAQGKMDGIGLSTQNLFEEFQKQGQDVIPYFFPQKINQGLASGFDKGRCFAFPYTWSTILSIACPPTFSIHGNLHKDIDIFHATDHMVPKLKNVPTIATINDALMFKHPAWHSMRFGRLKKIARKKSLAWADHFITISQAMVPDLVEFAGVKEENISVVYLGISAGWHQPVSAETKELLLQKYQLPKKFLLFTGTLQQRKNLPRLIQAYLELPTDIQEEYPLVIVGRAGWGTEESLAAIQELTNMKRGYWLKYVERDELRTLFQLATVYLHPSLYEGFGLTLLEAFATKTPVITSNIAALPEIAGGAAFLIDPYSIEEISGAMQTVLTQTSLRETLVEKGLQRVKMFSWEKCARETLKVYKKVLSG